MDVSFHAVQMLCGLAAPVFASTPHPHRWRSLTIAAASALASLWILDATRAPDAAWTGIAATMCAAYLLMRPDRAESLGAAASGAAAGMWIATLRAGGAPWVVVGPLGLAPWLAAWALTTRRPRFAPPLVRDEALLILATLGLCVAMTPTVSDGWRTATALNVHGVERPPAIPPAWVLASVSAPALFGACYAAWRRR